MSHNKRKYGSSILGRLWLGLIMGLLLVACGDTPAPSSSLPGAGSPVVKQSNPAPGSSSTTISSGGATVSGGSVRGGGSVNPIVSLNSAVLDLGYARTYHFILDKTSSINSGGTNVPVSLHLEGDVAGKLFDKDQKIHYNVQDKTQYPAGLAKQSKDGEYLEVYKKEAAFNHELYIKKGSSWQLVTNSSDVDVYNLFASVDYLNLMDLPTEPVAGIREQVEGQDCMRYDFVIKNNQKSIWVSSTSGQIVRYQVKDEQSKGRWKPFIIVYSKINEPITITEAPS